MCACQCICVFSNTFFLRIILVKSHKIYQQYSFDHLSQNRKIDPSIFISFDFPLILLLFQTIRLFRFLFLFESIKLPLKNHLH